MNKTGAFSLTALLTIAAMAVATFPSNAQGNFQNPLQMGAAAGALAETGGKIINVQSRRSRRRRNRAIGGAIVGGIIAGAIIAEQNRRYNRRPRRRVYHGNPHEDWCFSRYRSYRAWDNTYQPYNGRRRQCISPYY